MKLEGRGVGVRLAILLVAVIVAAGILGRVFACGPYPLQLFFDFAKHPDYPLEKYARGELSILQRRYSTDALFAAYRHLQGPPLQEWEIENLKRHFKDAGRQAVQHADPQAAAEEWDRVSTTLTGRHRRGHPWVYKEVPNGYGSFLNCPADAFVTARETLRQRAEAFGPRSPQVLSWLGAQDRVFENCGGRELALPEAASADLPLLLRKDRDYQTAAARFYGGDFEVAGDAFERIAQDPDSPWRWLGSYLAARCHIRVGTLHDRAALAKADNRLRAILKDPAQQRIHEAARGMLQFVRLRTDRDLLVRGLSRRLRRQVRERWTPDDLWDLAFLIDSGRRVPRKEQDAAQDGQDLDLVDWMTSMRRGIPAPADIWERERSLPWLIAALIRIEPGDARTEPILEASAAISPDSPAYATAVFYRSLLMLRLGTIDQARTEVADALSHHSDRFSPSAWNAMRALRARLAASFEDFARYAPRKPVAFMRGPSGLHWFLFRPDGTDLVDGAQWYRLIGNRRGYFDSDASWVLSREIPVDLLTEAAIHGQWERHLRRELTVAAWTRAILLGRSDLAFRSGSLLRDLEPRLKKDMGAYLAAKSDEERGFATWFLLLRNPGLRYQVQSGLMREKSVDKLDRYGCNWWNAFSHAADSNGLMDEIYGRRISWEPDFLTADQKRQAEEEERRLREIPPPHILLTSKAVELAKAHPEDPRVPEMLHRAVMATRWVSWSVDEGAGSRAAFRLLHSRYPNSPWTAKTPYWFK